jgi:sensor histidine kinase YesM
MVSRRYLFAFMISLCQVVSAKAQDTIVLTPRLRWDSSLTSNNYATFYIDESDQKDISSVLKETFHTDSNFLPHVMAHYGTKRITVWIRWIFHNASPVTEPVMLLFDRYSFLSLYTVENNQPRFLKNSFYLFTWGTEDQRRSFEFDIPAGHTIQVYGRMTNPYRNYSPEDPAVIRPAEYQNLIRIMVTENLHVILIFALFLSIILFTAIHSLALYYFNNKRKEFLQYSFYAICVFAYALSKFEANSYINILFSHFPFVHIYGNEPLNYLMFYAYFRFVNNFIDFNEIAPWFYKTIGVTEKVLLVSIAANIVFALFNWIWLQDILFDTLRPAVALLGFIGVFLLLRSGKTLALFIGVGSACLIIGSLAAMIMTWMMDIHYRRGFQPFIYMQAGIVIELLCFTLGLSYKTSLIEKDKIRAQQELIGQLEENKNLQDELTNKLEIRVEEQTSRLLHQQKQIEQEKETHLTLEFQKKLTEMELQLLKSQLNPHFYFNTLNNLYGLSMIAPKKAPDAILKLSDIMEYVIYDCRSEKVPLHKELKFIKSYVDLERLRYDEQAAIQFHIEGDSDGHMISPLLLIQFIENAFKHGLEENKSDCFLSITIKVQDGWLIYHSLNSVSLHKYETGGLGHENVKKRLDILYAGQHELLIHSNQEVYEVNLKLHL